MAQRTYRLLLRQCDMLPLAVIWIMQFNFISRAWSGRREGNHRSTTARLCWLRGPTRSRGYPEPWTRGITRSAYPYEATPPPHHMQWPLGSNSYGSNSAGWTYLWLDWVVTRFTKFPSPVCFFLQNKRDQQYWHTLIRKVVVYLWIYLGLQHGHFDLS